MHVPFQKVKEFNMLTRDNILSKIPEGSIKEMSKGGVMKIKEGYIDAGFSWYMSGLINEKIKGNIYESKNT